MLKNDFLDSQGKVAMDKSVRSLCHFFSGFDLPKIIKISQFLTELFKK